MLLRIWRTRINVDRRDEYQHFGRTRSLPMFRQQPGLMGVLFLREGADQAAALTLWDSMESIDALATSPTYRETAGALGRSSLLLGEQSVEVFDIRGGEIMPRFAGALRP